tara:strand:- start:15208 stop:16041 length:834 start_codon:yes stop_codon:yes gene_type:complete
MHYTEVNIRLKELNPFSDIIVARFHEIEFESYIEDENGVKAYIQTHLLDEELVNSILVEVSEQTDLSYKINQVEPENWNRKWENNFLPIFINDKCVVRANFHEPIADIEYEIVITPKMSFGTGHHETTSLVMNQMFELDFKNKSVLDIGSGTGVLAILASLLGANYLVGVDIDDWAFKNGIDNANINNVFNIKFFHGNIKLISEEKFDVILANINRNIILQDIKNYVELMNERSDILLSGFLKDDVALILDKSEQLGLKLVGQKNNNKWQMLHLRKA